MLIGNVADLIQSRSFSRRYPAVVLWNIFLVLLVVEMWVASPFLSHSEAAIKTGSFLLFILLPTAVTLLAYLLQPVPGKYEIELEVLEDGTVLSEDEESHARPPANARTLEQSFNLNRFYFFGILLALPVVSVMRELLAGQFVLESNDLGFRALVAVGAVFGLFLRGRLANTILAAVMIVIIVLYILVVFPTVAATGGGA